MKTMTGKPSRGPVPRTTPALPVHEMLDGMQRLMAVLPVLTPPAVPVFPVEPERDPDRIEAQFDNMPV